MEKKVRLSVAMPTSCYAPHPGLMSRVDAEGVLEPDIIAGCEPDLQGASKPSHRYRDTERVTFPGACFQLAFPSYPPPPRNQGSRVK